MNNDPIDRDVLLVLYAETTSEVTRYRDREWQNATLFLAAQAAIVALAITNKADLKPFSCQVEVACYAMAIANIYYTSYAHHRLTIMRRERGKLRVALGLVDGLERVKWTRGFWSHLLPFFLSTLAVAIFSSWVLWNP